MPDFKKFVKKMVIRIKNLKYENRLSDEFKERNLWWKDEYPEEQTRFEVCLMIVGLGVFISMFILLVKMLGQETVIMIVRIGLSTVGTFCLLYPLWILFSFIIKHFRLPDHYEDEKNEKISTKG